MLNKSATVTGCLYIVATPIGNRDDITIRAINTLKEVDLILAEDTRTTAKLLNMHGIKKPIQSLHEHNEKESTTAVINKLKSGYNIALVSDAGTPLISDPGFILVKSAREAEVTVIPIPGPSALITALSASGIATDRFMFVGFLGAKQSLRINQLEELKNITQTLIFYESTHRIINCCEDIAIVFGVNAKIVLAKELTKAHEKIVSGSVAEIITFLTSNPTHKKGEFVLIIPKREKEATSKFEPILKKLLKEYPLKEAVKIACLITDEKKNKVYQEALNLTHNSG